MNKFRFGFNANATLIGNRDYFIDTVTKIKPAWMLIMSDVGLAEQLHNALGGQSNVIDRHWSPYEGRQWRELNAYEYAHSKMDGRKHIWKYILNEPSVYNDQEAIDRNNWLAAVASWLADEGYKCVVGNFGQDIQLDHINKGYYDTLLKVASERSDLVKIGYHEYTGVLLPIGSQSWTPEDYLHPERVQPEEWLELNPSDPLYQLPDYTKELLPYYFHLFRFSWLQHRSIQVHNKEIRFVHTEFGHDRMTDDERRPSGNIYQQLEQKHGTPHPFWMIRGAYTLGNVWRDYYPNWTPLMRLAKQWEWYDRNCAGWVEGFMPFMWSFGDEWDNLYGFNYGADTDLHQYLIEWSTRQSEGEQPDPDPDPIIIEEGNNVSVDMLDYMLGDGRIYRMDYKFPGNPDGQEGFQVVRSEAVDRRFFHVKGDSWEELWYDHDYIWRGTDISPNNLEYYQISENAGILQGGSYGARWIPRFPKVGQKFNIDSWVTFRKKSSNEPVPEKPAYLFRHSIELKKVYSKYTFPSGVTLDNVVELWGYLEDGLNFERYFYAKDYGLVRWLDPTKNPRWDGYISSTPSNDFIPRRQINGLVLPTLPQLPPKEDDTQEFPTVTFPLSDTRWQTAFISSNRSSWNVRTVPTTENNTPIDRITLNQGRHGLILLEESSTQDDGIWIPIRLSDDEYNPMENKDGFTKFGWVRSDGIDYDIYEPTIPDPDPPPSDVDKYIDIPFPEMGATVEEYVELAQIFGLYGDKLEKHLAYIRWMETVLENWQVVENQNLDGLVIKKDS